MAIVIKTDDVENNESQVSPHLALTSKDLQGGSANKRNVSLLMKSDVEITDEAKQILKAILGDKTQDIVIEKASYETLRKKLNTAITKFSKDKWDWSYVEDFDETNVVFSNSDGVYYVDYRVENDQVSLGNTATPVNRVISFEEASGKLILSESDKVDGSVRSLIVKAFESISNNGKVMDVFKSKLEKGKQMDEIQKAHDLLKAEVATLTEQLTKAAAEKDEAVAKLAEIEKAAADSKSAQRLEIVKSVVTESAEAEALFKSIEALEDAAFDIVIKSMKAKQEALEGTDLFKQASSTIEVTGEQESSLSKLLKSRFPEAQA